MSLLERQPENVFQAFFFFLVYLQMTPFTNWQFLPILSALFTEKYGDFIEANRTEDSVERLKELKRLVSKHLVCC